MHWFIEKLTKLLIKYCEKRGKVYQITGGPKGKTVYLQRYIVFKSKMGCIYIHRFLRSDADDPHSHPWNFFTYVISGGYTEYYYDKTKPIFDKNGNILQYWSHKIIKRTPGSLRYRRALDIHKVKVDREIDLQVDENSPEKLAQAPLTICIMGSRKQEWGFWNQDGSLFTDWRKYLKITANDSRIEGSE